MLTETVLRVTARNELRRLGNYTDQTLQFLANILAQLKYRGTWEVTFRQGYRKKRSRRQDPFFQVVGETRQGILFRVKPAGHDNCWEASIAPPKGYLMDQILADLKRVTQEGALINPRPVINLQTVPVAQPLQQVEVTIPSEPDEQQDEEQPQSVEEIQSTQLPIPSPVEKPVESSVMEAKFLVPSATTDKVLRIYPSGNLKENSRSLMNGLVAISFGLDRDGHIMRQRAVELLIEELDLTNFVHAAPEYTEPVRAATVILSGLCDRGLLSRWIPHRKRNRVRDTTKGYIITPFGRQKLEGLRDKYPEQIQQKITTPVPHTAESDLQGIEELQVLLEQLKQMTRNADEYNLLLVDLYAKKAEIENKVEPVRKRIEALRLEIAQLESSIPAEDTRDLERDIDEITESMQRAQAEIAEIRKRMRTKV